MFGEPDKDAFGNPVDNGVWGSRPSDGWGNAPGDLYGNPTSSVPDADSGGGLLDFLWDIFS